MTQKVQPATGALFDNYADVYREVINRSIRRSGEEYEFFIDLRVRMMSTILQRYRFRRNRWPREVLDFGCGTGATAPFFRKYMPDANLFGVDISCESIRVAQAMDKSGMEFINSNGKTLPYKDDLFDVIYMNGVIHHVPADDRMEVLRELWRVMAAGSFMFIFENNPWNPFMVQAMRENPFDVGANAIKLSKLAKLSANAGFLVSGSWYYCFFPHSLKFMRPLEPKLGRFPLGAQYCVWVAK